MAEAVTTAVVLLTALNCIVIGVLLLMVGRVGRALMRRERARRRALGAVLVAGGCELSAG
jgi:threonine/homoserine/homoserine lactone efflux protein